MRATVLVGNPKPRSRTLEAGCHVARELTGREPDRIVDLVDLGSALLDWTSAAIADVVSAVSRSDLVIVASPTYKGAYTGLLKLFLDRFAGGSLQGVTAVPLMLGADLRHSLAPEVFLKPVLAELGASCPTRGLFLLDSGWAESAVLADWLVSARTELCLKESV